MNDRGNRLIQEAVLVEGKLLKKANEIEKHLDAAYKAAGDLDELLPRGEYVSVRNDVQKVAREVLGLGRRIPRLIQAVQKIDK